MTMYVLASVQNVVYWFFILPLFVIFLTASICVVIKDFKLGKNSPVTTAFVHLLWLMASLTYVMHSKTLTCINDLINNPVPVTIALFASTLISFICLCVLSVYLENQQRKKGSEDNQIRDC